jgi:LEA14-like dessication related protein
MKKALLIIGGLGVLGFGLYKYFTYQAKKLLDFDWSLSGIKINKFSLTELNLVLTIRLTSKADIEAKVEKLYLDLYLMGVRVGYVNEDKPFVIPSRGSSDIPLNISISPQIIFKNIIDVTSGIGKNKDVMFKFDGFANIKSGFVSTTLPIKYETSIKKYLANITPNK